jgi:hypothetical protein
LLSSLSSAIFQSLLLVSTTFAAAAAPYRVAIVGAGIGGASASYWVKLPYLDVFSFVFCL